jgi:hypothetical protein
MKKELGKWFMDISKYIATAVLISSFLGDFEQRWIMYLTGILTVVFCLFMGMYFLKKIKIKCYGRYNYVHCDSRIGFGFVYL